MQFATLPQTCKFTLFGGVTPKPLRILRQIALLAQHIHRHHCLDALRSTEFKFKLEKLSCLICIQPAPVLSAAIIAAGYASIHVHSEALIPIRSDLPAAGSVAERLFSALIVT